MRNVAAMSFGIAVANIAPIGSDFVPLRWAIVVAFISLAVMLTDWKRGDRS